LPNLKNETRIVLAVALSCDSVYAKNPAAHLVEAKQNYQGVKNNLQRMAEQMPEESYSFKATPDVRTFGELVAHVADTQARLCSMAVGSRNR